MIRRLAAVMAAALVLVACGEDDTAGRYDARVDQVRQAVEVGDRGAALAGLEQLGTEAFYAHAEGEITAEEVDEVARLLDHARAQLDQELPAPTTTTEATTTTTTTAPPTTPPAPVFDHDDDDDDDDDEKKKDKENRGNGRGGDDGDDDDDD